MGRTIGKAQVIERVENGGPWWQSVEWYVPKGDDSGGSRWKGWWTVGPKHCGDHAEVEVAVGGEDAMIQVGFAIPKVARFYIGRAVPRGWLASWVHERRTWAVRPGYAGSALYVDVAYDDSMGDMADYYRRCRERGDKMHTTPRQEHPGWQWRVGSLRDMLLGPARMTRVNLGSDREPVGPDSRLSPLDERLTVLQAERKYDHMAGAGRSPLQEPLIVTHAMIPMPEGNYPAVVSLHRDEWRRPRAFWRSQVVYRAEVTPRVPIPVPGKGYGDDATHAMCCRARTVPQAVAVIMESTLESRARRASLGWVPDAGWSTEVQR